MNRGESVQLSTLDVIEALRLLAACHIADVKVAALRYIYVSNSPATWTRIADHEGEAREQMALHAPYHNHSKYFLSI